MLTIPDKLFILSIDDHKSTVNSSVTNALPYGIAGGLLAELALAGKIRVEKERLVLVDPSGIGDDLFDDLLATILNERKPRKLSHWITSIGGNHPFKQVSNHLAGQNVIRIEKKRFLWVIPYEVYPQVDASAKYWVKQHLRSIVLAGEKPEPADIILLSLLKGCGLLPLVFTQDERKSARKKLNELVEGEVFGEYVKETLEEIESATMTAVMAAVTTT